jgi:simple sugar transport system ATP-binding protein
MLSPTAAPAKTKTNNHITSVENMLPNAKQGISIRLESISKRFGNVLANDAVNVNIAAGTVHALLGENGAGKSTLMRILAGYHQPDGGSIKLNGNPVTINSQVQARKLGIGMVHQRLSLVPSLTVLENILLGDSKTSFIIDAKKAYKQISAKMAELGFTFDLFSPVWRLTSAEQQKVEIFKLLWKDAQVLILDEPTSQLSPLEAEEVLSVVRDLASSGRTVILITHHIEEILKFASEITILKNGQSLSTHKASQIKAADLAKLMIDDSVNQIQKIPAKTKNEIYLKLDNISLHQSANNRRLTNINLELLKGEVLGIAGLTGSGQDEIAGILSGQIIPNSGTLYLEGKELPWKVLQDPCLCAAHIPAHQFYGSIPSMSLIDNFLLRDISNKQSLMLNKKHIQEKAEKHINQFQIRPNNPSNLAGNLSGGNLQRMIIARELNKDANLVIAVNPCAGLDMAATQYVLQELRNFANQGKTVVLISPSLDEMLLVSDRIAVVCAGKITGVKDTCEISSESIGLMMGGLE